MRGETAPPVANRGAITATIIMRLHHAGARHHDRQCRAAAYPGQHVGGAGPDLVGLDLLHRVLGDHDAADRVARRPLWRQVHLSRLGHRVHACLGVVRRGDEPGPARGLSPAARRLQRRAGAARAGDPVHDLSARAPRLRDGDLQHRRDDGADHRPDPRRLADRELRLAMVLLYQPAGRGACAPSASSCGFASPAPCGASRSTCSALPC